MEVRGGQRLGDGGALVGGFRHGAFGGGAFFPAVFQVIELDGVLVAGGTGQGGLDGGQLVPVVHDDDVGNALEPLSRLGGGGAELAGAGFLVGDVVGADDGDDGDAGADGGTDAGEAVLKGEALAGLDAQGLGGVEVDAGIGLVARALGEDLGVFRAEDLGEIGAQGLAVVLDAVDAGLDALQGLLVTMAQGFPSVWRRWSWGTMPGTGVTSAARTAMVSCSCFLSRAG